MNDRHLTSITPSPAAWDAFALAHPRAHLLQMSGWGAHKSDFGWRHALTAVAEGGALVGGALLLFRPLPARLGSMAYLAMGPLEPADASAANTATLWATVHRAAKAHGAAFLRWEPGLFSAPAQAPNPHDLGFHPAFAHVQPPRTIIIALGDDEAMLARMNQGTRRKIRQSLKGEVHYRFDAPGDVARFTTLMQATGERNAFGIYDPAYYAGMYAHFAPQHAALVLAEHEGEALAGVMVFALGAQAWYLYGASSDVKRNLMASYGVQWHAIQWARAQGCTTYDMWGIPDAEPDQLEAEFETRSDGLWGVYGFKRGWGGQIVRSLGTWDYVYNPLVYRLNQMAAKRREHRNRAD